MTAAGGRGAFLRSGRSIAQTQESSTDRRSSHALRSTHARLTCVAVNTAPARARFGHSERSGGDAERDPGLRKHAPVRERVRNRPDVREPRRYLGPSESGGGRLRYRTPGRSSSAQIALTPPDTPSPPLQSAFSRRAAAPRSPAAAPTPRSPAPRPAKPAGPSLGSTQKIAVGPDLVRSAALSLHV
jgi:hypothetical protein